MPSRTTLRLLELHNHQQKYSRLRCLLRLQTRSLHQQNLHTLESQINVPLCLLISRGYARSYYGRKRLKFYYTHFKGLHLFFLSNFPEATFIQGATSIPDSRVLRSCPAEADSA